VLLVEIKKIAMLKVRVVLNLVDSRFDLGCLENRLKMHLQEVRNTNRLGLSRFLDLFQLRPALLKVLVGLSKPGAVDQVKIDVVKAELLEGNVEGVNGRTLLLSRDLGGDIKLFTRNTASLDGLSELFFVAVYFWLVSIDIKYSNYMQSHPRHHRDGGIRS
jgi:hypothetical protein